MADTITDYVPATADDCFKLGIAVSSGRDGAVDLVAAHQWFNIAASRGHVDAAQMRREIAAQMTDSEIGLAQCAARNWLKAHPVEAVPAPAPALRVAA